MFNPFSSSVLLKPDSVKNQAKEILEHFCSRDGSGNDTEVRLLIDEHPSLLNVELDNYGSTALILASTFNYIKIIKYFLTLKQLNINQQNKSGRTALHFACSKGWKEIVQSLLSHQNIDINIRSHTGYTPLHLSSAAGHRDIVELFLSHNSINVNIQNNDGETALIRATTNGHKEIVELLLSHESTDVNLQNKTGWVALHWASYYDQKEITELLLSNINIDINIQNNVGDTSLHSASYNGNNKIVELLLSHNYIDINLRDTKGMQAIDVCCDGVSDKSNKSTIIELLKNHNEAKTPSKLPSTTNTITKYSKEASFVSTKKDVSKNIEVMERVLADTVPDKVSGKAQVPDLQDDSNSRFQEKERECLELRDQIIRMEDRFNAWMKEMERRNKSLERRLEEKERVLQEILGGRVKSLPLPPNKKTHVFLTHTWREDEEGRNNHDRVGRVNEALRERGLVTWFDSERMSGTVRQAMTEALDATCCVLIFITKKYEEKVNSKNEADNCYFEFNVAAHDKNLTNMRIPIVMEECMLNERYWKGRLKAEMGHQLYFDLARDEEGVLEKQYDKVVERVVKLLAERYQEVSFDNNFVETSSMPSMIRKSSESSDNIRQAGKNSPSLSQWYERLSERIVLLFLIIAFLSFKFVIVLKSFW